jgi:hypothetical protein
MIALKLQDMVLAMKGKQYGNDVVITMSNSQGIGQERLAPADVTAIMNLTVALLF